MSPSVCVGVRSRRANRTMRWLPGCDDRDIVFLLRAINVRCEFPVGIVPRLLRAASERTFCCVDLPPHFATKLSLARLRLLAVIGQSKSELFFGHHLPRDALGITAS